MMVRVPFSNLPEEELNRDITILDRYVADGWFDICRPNPNYKYRKYRHNVPASDSDRGTIASDRSTFLNRLDNLTF